LCARPAASYCATRVPKRKRLPYADSGTTAPVRRSVVDRCHESVMARS
jgi:hypothetical protein